MIYRQIFLNSIASETVETEIIFELASARADGVELLRFDVAKLEDDKAYNKLMRSIKKILRVLKERSMVQFFAMPDNFINSGTESKFLINKYPDVFEEMLTDGDDGMYFYLKI